MARLAALAFAVAACSSTSTHDGIRGCPRPNWPGPWTACAEARWVEDVVEAGGYEVPDPRGTGSALVAVGRGRAFYVWAASGGRGGREPADDGVRTSWSCQGFTFWISSGPSETEEKPRLGELAPLIAASCRIPPPQKEKRRAEARRFRDARR